MSSEEIKSLCEEFSNVNLGVGQAADRLLQHQILVWGARESTQDTGRILAKDNTAEHRTERLFWLAGQKDGARVLACDYRISDLAATSEKRLNKGTHRIYHSYCVSRVRR